MRALVLSGGGSHGAWQAGAIAHLMERGHQWDVIVGTSVGAINGAMLSTLGVDEMLALWYGIKSRRDVMRFQFPLPWKYSGVYNFKPLEKLIRKKIIGKSFSIQTYATVVDLKRIEDVAIPLGVSDALTLDALIGSSSIAGIHVLPKSLWVDGGHREVAPVKYAKAMGATEIDVVLADPVENGASEWSPNGILPLPAIAFRGIQAMVNEILEADVASDCHVYAPITSLPYDPLDYRPSEIRIMIQRGYSLDRSQ